MMANICTSSTTRRWSRTLRLTCWTSMKPNWLSMLHTVTSLKLTFHHPKPRSTLCCARGGNCMSSGGTCSCCRGSTLIPSIRLDSTTSINLISCSWLGLMVLCFPIDVSYRHHLLGGEDQHQVGQVLVQHHHGHNAYKEGIFHKTHTSKPSTRDWIGIRVSS